MIGVIRVRGEVNVRKDITDTLCILGLDRKNQLVLKPQNPTMQAMVQKVADFVTFGPIDAPTLSMVLKKRGRLAGNRRLNEAFLKKHKIDSFETLAQSILNGKKTLQELGIKKVFRLHAPRKGFERGGIKKRFSDGGALGNRKEQINQLIQKMV